MAIQKDTIKKQINKVLRAYPELDTATGQMYSHGNEKRGKTKQIVMYSLFVSDAGTFLLRPHTFKSAKPKTPAQWNKYLSEKYGEILPRILSGMASRTGKKWRVYKTLGWAKDDTSRSKNTALRTRRNKNTTKRSN